MIPTRMALLPLALLLTACLAPRIAAAALPVDTTVTEVNLVDRGTFRIFVDDKALGSETFSFAIAGESLLVFSRTLVTLAPIGSPDSIEKDMNLIAGAQDFDLLSYSSYQRYQGRDLRRGLIMNDTLYSAFREMGSQGMGDRRVRPPGRIYVEDPQLYVLYDLICRNLHGKVFEERPIQFLILGERDSLMDATITDLGVEPLSWGTRTVQARKLWVRRSDAQFTMWTSPRGEMLKLTQPDYGLRVEREPPPAPAKAKAPAKPPKKRPRAG
jgi:hypothetical protein